MAFQVRVGSVCLCCVLFLSRFDRVWPLVLLLGLQKGFGVSQSHAFRFPKNLTGSGWDFLSVLCALAFENGSGQTWNRGVAHEDTARVYSGSTAWRGPYPLINTWPVVPTKKEGDSHSFFEKRHGVSGPACIDEGGFRSADHWGFAAAVNRSQEPAVADFEPTGLNAGERPKPAELNPHACNGASSPPTHVPKVLGSRSHPAHICGTQYYPYAGTTLKAKSPLSIGGVPGLSGAARTTEFDVAFDCDPDEAHATRMFEGELLRRPVEGRRLVCDAVDDTTCLMNGVRNFVLQVVPAKTEPSGAGQGVSAFNPAANSGVELRGGEGRGVEVDRRVELGRHVGCLDVVQGKVDARADEAQVRFAVFGAVVTPVRVPSGIAFWCRDVAYGALHGGASGLGQGSSPRQNQQGRKTGLETAVNC